MRNLGKFIRTQHERVKTNVIGSLASSLSGAAGPSNWGKGKGRATVGLEGRLKVVCPPPWWCCVQGSCLSTSLLLSAPQKWQLGFGLFESYCS